MLKKSQFTLEFLLIFVLAFFVFLVILAFVIRLADANQVRSEQKRLEIFADSVKSELILAQDSGSHFESEIEIPDQLSGLGYNLSLDEDADVLIVTSAVLNVSATRVIPDVKGCFKKGCKHLIVKQGGVINIDPILPCSC